MSHRPPRLTAEHISPADLNRCTEIFEAATRDPKVLAKLSKDERIRLLIAIGQAIRPDQAESRRRVKAIRNAKYAERREANRAKRAETEIRTARAREVFVAPLPLPDAAARPPRGMLETPDYCYICKSPFTELHHFYDALCPECARFNYEKRFQSCSLAGRSALITGARVKIGYQSALLMLRAGAKVIVTTRFPHDAALRYMKEPDFKEWGGRLRIYGLDLRHSPSVEAFTRQIEHTTDRLDILINNACQTVRRPPGFYSHLLELETSQADTLPREAQLLVADHTACKKSLTHIGAGSGWLSEWHQGRIPGPVGLTASAELSQIPYTCEAPENLDPALFPSGRLDADLQQVDLRSMNSWRMTLADVPTAEMLEVQLVNSVAPFILCGKLKPLMIRSGPDQKHIVNVSAMEGKFARHTKTDKHPHTNMAKAALNMMTLTSAPDYAKAGIYMNAVDTGWVTDEDPAEISARKQREQDFQPPLDIVDGAARVIDPIFTGYRTGQPTWGQFLKDYRPTEW